MGHFSLSLDDISQADQKNFRPFFVTGSEIFGRQFRVLQPLAQNLYVVYGLHKLLPGRPGADELMVPLENGPQGLR